MSQSNKRKATPREIKKPLATVPLPTIYVLSKNSPRSLNIQVKLTSLTLLASISTSALLDSGATGMFINRSFVQKHQLETTPLHQPILVCNVDSSPNENGSVTAEVCQGTSETGDVLCPSAHRAPMYLWNGHSRG